MNLCNKKIARVCSVKQNQCHTFMKSTYSYNCSQRIKYIKLRTTYIIHILLKTIYMVSLFTE